jgi:hypothetical protein
MFPASRLDALPDLYDSRRHDGRAWPRRPIALALASAALCAALIWGGGRWQPQLVEAGSASGVPGVFTGTTDASAAVSALHPFVVLLKLGAAALIGLLVTAVHRHVYRDRTGSRSMEHAQTLLCVSGAMMMIIIGNSLARAFGIAGADAIIRFRTPVDDPRDTTILFLLLALGMAAGIGALPLAGLGTLCLCLLLPALDRVSDPATRSVAVEFLARGPEFPSAHVHQVFGRHAVSYEPREMSQGESVRVKYHATIGPAVCLEDLSQELLRDESIASLSWETRKKG